MASTDVQTVGGAADTAKVATAALLAVGGFVAYFLLSAQGAAAQWGGLIGCMVLGAVVFFTAHTGRVFIGFCVTPSVKCLRWYGPRVANLCK